MFTPTPVGFGPDGQLLVDGSKHWLAFPTSGDEPPRILELGGVRPAGDAFIFSVADREARSRDWTLVARCSAFSREDRLSTLEVIETATQATLSKITVEGLIRRPAFSPDGQIVYAIADKVIQGWNVRTGQQVMRGKSRAGDLVNRLLVSSDGRYLATADMVLADVQRAESIQVWDATTGEAIFSAEAGHGRPYIAFSPDGRHFAATVAAEDPQATPHEVRVWDLGTRKVIATFPGYDGQPAFSPDGRTVAVTKDDAVVLLEMATRKPRHAFRHHGTVEPAIAWRADGRVLAAASPEAPMYLWDVVGDRTGAVPEWDPAHDDRRWDALTGDDAPEAFQAVRHLWANPVKAIPFLNNLVKSTADAKVASRACESLELMATADARALLTAWADGPPDAPRTKEAKDSLRRLPALTK